MQSLTDHGGFRPLRMANGVSTSSAQHDPRRRSCCTTVLHCTAVVAHDCEGVEIPDDESPVPGTRLLSVRIDFSMRAFGRLHQ